MKSLESLGIEHLDFDPVLPCEHVMHGVDYSEGHASHMFWVYCPCEIPAYPICQWHLDKVLTSSLYCHQCENDLDSKTIKYWPIT